MDDDTGFNAQLRSIEVPCLRCGAHEHLASCSARPPNHRYSRWRRPAARGRAVVRRYRRISQHYPQRFRGDAELFGRRLEDLGSRALPDLDLARQDDDRSVLAQVQPRRRRDLSGCDAGAEDNLARGRDEQSGAHDSDPLTAVQLEAVRRALGELLAIGLEQIFAESLRHRSPPRRGRPAPPTPRCCDSRNSGTGAGSSRRGFAICSALDSV